MIFLHSYDRNRVIINIMTNVDYRKLWKLLIDKGIKNKTHIVGHGKSEKTDFRHEEFHRYPCQA